MLESRGRREVVMFQVEFPASLIDDWSTGYWKPIYQLKPEVIDWLVEHVGPGVVFPLEDRSSLVHELDGQKSWGWVWRYRMIEGVNFIRSPVLFCRSGEAAVLFKLTWGGL